MPPAGIASKQYYNDLLYLHELYTEHEQKIATHIIFTPDAHPVTTLRINFQYQQVMWEMEVL